MKQTQIGILILVIAILIFSQGIFAQQGTSPKSQGLQFSKNLQLQSIKPYNPIQIKLRRSGDGKYSWDLSGSNPDEIARTNNRLKKLLNLE